MHTASDFTMKAVNEEGLTGCDAFSYIVIQENDENFTLIYPPDPENYPYPCAVLQQTDGISEGIENVSTMDNTLYVSILISYQEGSGSYTLKVYRAGSFWKSEETDRIRTYE